MKTLTATAQGMHFSFFTAMPITGLWWTSPVYNQIFINNYIMFQDKDARLVLLLDRLLWENIPV